MEYNEIPNKELKLTFHLLNFLQNSENLSADEKHIFDVLNDFFPEVADEKKTIFEYANSLKWIKVPELSNNRGGRTILPIDSSRIHHNETIKIAKSAKCAAWASAIGAIITALANLIALIFK